MARERQDIYCTASAAPCHILVMLDVLAGDANNVEAEVASPPALAHQRSRHPPHPRQLAPVHRITPPAILITMPGFHLDKHQFADRQIERYNINFVVGDTTVSGLYLISVSDEKVGGAVFAALAEENLRLLQLPRGQLSSL